MALRGGGCSLARRIADRGNDMRVFNSRARGEDHLSTRRVADRGSSGDDPDPRDLKIKRLRQRVRDLEMQQEIKRLRKRVHDLELQRVMRVKETESGTVAWDDVNEEEEHPLGHPPPLLSAETLIPNSLYRQSAYPLRRLAPRLHSLIEEKAEFFISSSIMVSVNNLDSMEPKITPEQAVKLCDRNFGIGADGVIFAMPGWSGTDYTMRIFNSDGSEPEMCGNGVRCFAKFISDLNKLNGRQSFTVHTGAGLIIPEIQDDGKVKVDMGEPVLKASDIPTKIQPNEDQNVVRTKIEVDGVNWNVTCVSMGNPHCVTFGRVGDQNLVVDELNLADIGPKFEHHKLFPARTNTEFVQVYSRSHLKMRVWERGAGATLACGTGACAVVVAAILEGRSERSCTVDLPGGPLEIEWREKDNHVYMTGPAEVVFYGSVEL